MKNIDLIEMIDEGFEDFERDRARRKNIRLLMDFESTEIEYSEKNMIMDGTPKLKQTFLSSIFIKTKKNKNTNSLF